MGPGKTTALSHGIIRVGLTRGCRRLGLRAGLAPLGLTRSAGA